MISACFISLFRSLFIALCATFFTQKIFTQHNALQGRKKNIFLFLALLPLIIPPLLPAYAYSAFSINFQTQTIYNEILYCLLMIFRVVPLVLILLMVVPPALSSSALHCEKLLPQKNLSRIFRNSRFLGILALTALFVFHDYETASLLRIKHWTVVLFNAHAGGLVMNLPGSLQLAALPAFISITFMLLSWKFISNCRGTFEYPKKANKLSFSLIAFSTLLMLIVPVLTVSTTSLSAYKDVFSGGWMLNEFINSLSLTSVSIICCAAFAWWIILVGKKTVLLGLIPGLFGSLILGLFLIYLFNLPVLSSTKHTVLPLTIGAILYGLPVAVLLCSALKKLSLKNKSEISLLSSQNQLPLKWQLLHRPAFLLSLPLFCFLWFDLTLSSMLAPASVTTLFPRIYNLMHYSENERLSATVIVVTFIPLLIYSLLYFILKMRISIASKSSLR